MSFFAILAILMIIASYVFVILLAAACVLLPYYVLHRTESPGFGIVVLFLFGVAIAAAMLWSLIPQRDKFNPPGPLLDRASHPRLFAEIDGIAAALDEPLPDEVYLTAEVNAWVTDRGGLMGSESRRVMGLGVPLLSILTVSQFRAVLAHEFAHYYGGDTRLGPWVYKTQKTLVRTFQNIGSLREFTRIMVLYIMYRVVTALLQGYFKLFLLAMNLVSRRKEYRADELACLIAGTQSMIEGLRAIHACTPAWRGYWDTEVSPVVSNGSLPPIGEGFARFLAAPQISERVEQGLKKMIQTEKTSYYDSHPPLRKRIAAIEMLTGSLPPQDTRPARELLDNLKAAERSLIAVLNPRLRADLQPVTWEEAGNKVLIPSWRGFVGKHSALLAGITAETLPNAIPKLQEIGSKISDPKGMLLTRDQRTRRAEQLLAMSFGLMLVDHGWEVHSQPGSLYFQRGNDQLDVFLTVRDIVSKKTTLDDWVAKCQELGISRLQISPGSG